MRWNAVQCDALKSPAAALAVLLAASMLLTGCGSDTKPDASPSSPATSSPPTTAAPAPTPSPTTAAKPTADPNIPTAARAHTTAGAEAFTRYFFEQLNTAWTVPRAGILAPLCRPSSKACAAFENSATRLASEGHRYDGNPVTVKFVGVLDRTGTNQLGVLANVVQERRSEIDSAGKVVLTDKRENLRFHFQLLYTGDAWSVLSAKLMK